MGQPAARISDMHLCPKVTSKVPHVGGPVAAGSGNVFIGGMPAARKGDKLVCVGPPDSISGGSSTVFINGKPAARMGDSTSHGGVIVAGMPTVLIGDQSYSVPKGPKPTSSSGEASAFTPIASREASAPSSSNSLLDLPADQFSATSSQVPPDEKGMGLAMKDQYGNPYSGCSYEISAGGKTEEGKTTGSGVINLEPFKSEEEVMIKFWPDPSDTENYQRKRVKMQKLASIDTPEGVQQRLANLALLSGQVDGNLGGTTKRDLKAMQFDREFAFTGEVDAETKAWLEENEK
ncbi:PAAR domain-containing protein [Photobacterium aphoticum]|uniref:PAAR domain-containing protein n=1 Tax=Photobacterium aphoticum TaxID=754436 RepID=UPI0009E41A23|nr:PAAR domain-containing protein [Photobacterium aphoticum]PSU54909.1 hypothetical protein C9I90_18465 [Photobacterium aphoticum]GHA43225.1 hypothetical protein GCM10007086_15920 [Photobacterium aphoticum]